MCIAVDHSWVPELRSRWPTNDMPPIILAALKGDVIEEKQFSIREYMRDARMRHGIGPPNGSAAGWPDPLHSGTLMCSPRLSPSNSVCIELLIPLNEMDEIVAVTPIEGQQMASAIGAASFIEVSSLTQSGLRQLFDESVRHGLRERARLALSSSSKSKGGRHKKCAVQ
jgi:hypothetical protein